MSKVGNRVVIAGAGSTGLMLACELGLLGVDTVVVDDHPTPRQDAPGMAVNATVVELLDQRGLAEQLRAGAVVFPHVQFSIVIPLDATAVPAVRERTLMLFQNRLEQALEERARTLGVEIRRGLRVTGASQDEDGVAVTVRAVDGGGAGTDGAEEVLRGRYLVGCDGPRSRVREAAGIEFRDTAWATISGLSGDLEVDFADLGPELIGVVNAATGDQYMGAPLEPGVMRVFTADFDRDAPADDVPVSLDEVRASVLRLTGAELKTRGARWLKRYTIVTGNAEAYRSGNIFLAGDAAHAHFPYNGQGIATGMHDAVNLGWKLAAELSGRAPAGLLDTYQAERRPVGARALATTQAQVALMYPRELADPLREFLAPIAAIPEVNRYLVETLTGTNVRYPIAPADGSDEAPHLLLGTRPAPRTPLKTEAGAGELGHTLHAGRGVLLDFTDGTYEEPAKGWSDRVDAVGAQPAPDLDAPALLLRPDGHVAWAGEGGADGLAAALRTWFGEPGTQS